MPKHTSNPCYRCGKERVVVRIWKEKIDYSVVTTTEMACPDRDCQKILDLDNLKQKEKTENAMKRRREFRSGRKRTKPVATA